jgi:hypothetical protein
MFLQFRWQIFEFVLLSMASHSIVFVDRIKDCADTEIDKSASLILWNRHQHLSDRWDQHIWSLKSASLMQSQAECSHPYTHVRCVNTICTHTIRTCCCATHHECNCPSQDVHVWGQTHRQMQHTIIATNGCDNGRPHAWHRWAMQPILGRPTHEMRNAHAHVCAPYNYKTRCAHDIEAIVCTWLGWTKTTRNARVPHNAQTCCAYAVGNCFVHMIVGMKKHKKKRTCSAQHSSMLTCSRRNCCVHMIGMNNHKKRRIRSALLGSPNPRPSNLRIPVLRFLKIHNLLRTPSQVHSRNLKRQIVGSWNYF